MIGRRMRFDTESNGGEGGRSSIRVSLRCETRNPSLSSLRSRNSSSVDPILQGVDHLRAKLAGREIIILERERRPRVDPPPALSSLSTFSTLTPNRGNSRRIFIRISIVPDILLTQRPPTSFVHRVRVFNATRVLLPPCSALSVRK